MTTAVTSHRRTAELEAAHRPLSTTSSTHDMKDKPEEEVIFEDRYVSKGVEHVRRYRRSRLLGKGGFAKCYLVTELATQKEYACKIVSKSSFKKVRTKEKLRSEIKIHTHLNHRNIVKFEHVFEDSQNVYIILELCSNQTMLELLKRKKRLSETESKFFIRQILQALSYLQRHRIIHRDLKLGNLFLAEGNIIKVGDFGLAASLSHDEERKKTICGTPNYIAPEVLDNSKGHSFEVDIWSLGVILYTLLIGRPPFETSDVKSTYRRIKSNQYSFPDNVKLSDHAKDLISSILQTDPKKRPTLESITIHPFMSSPENEKIVKRLEALDIREPLRSIDNTARERIDKPLHDAQKLQEDVPQTARAGLRVRNPTTRNVRPASARPAEAVPVSSTVPTRAQTSSAGADRKGLLTARSRADGREHGLNYDKSPALPQSKPDGAAHSGPSVTATASHSSADRSGNSRNGIIRTEEHDHDVLKIILKRLSDCLSGATPSSSRSPLKGSSPYSCGDVSGRGPPLWVSKWVDYSKKYGLGYQLNDGFVGVYFNDSTKIILDTSTGFFDYVERRGKPGCSDRYDVVCRHDLRNYPNELSKKVTLLRHFTSYLDPDLNIDVLDPTMVIPPPTSSLVFVKKWLRTRHAIIMRLSNDVFQVTFNDHSEIVLASDSPFVSYVNKEEERTIRNLAETAIDSHFAKRVKYVKEVLQTLLTKGSAGSAQNGN